MRTALLIAAALIAWANSPDLDTFDQPETAETVDTLDDHDMRAYAASVVRSI